MNKPTTPENKEDHLPGHPLNQLVEKRILNLLNHEEISSSQRKILEDLLNENKKKKAV